MNVIVAIRSTSVIIGGMLRPNTRFAFSLATSPAAPYAVAMRSFSDASGSCPLRNTAHRAGESVKAFKAEKPMAMAIVKPNCW